MKKFFNMTSLVMIALLITGCSIGKEKTFCEENGADYSNAGVCDEMLDILENPNEVIQRAYRNTGKCGR